MQTDHRFVKTAVAVASSSMTTTTNQRAYHQRACRRTDRWHRLSCQRGSRCGRATAAGRRDWRSSPGGRQRGWRRQGTPRTDWRSVALAVHQTDWHPPDQTARPTPLSTTMAARTDWRWPGSRQRAALQVAADQKAQKDQGARTDSPQHSVYQMGSRSRLVARRTGLLRAAGPRRDSPSASGLVHRRDWRREQGRQTGWRCWRVAHQRDWRRRRRQTDWRQRGWCQKDCHLLKVPRPRRRHCRGCQTDCRQLAAVQ